MKEYIEREALLDKSQLAYKIALCEDDIATGKYDYVEFTDSFAVDEDDIIEAPAADVAPVVHGEWIKKCDDGWYCVECSVCGYPPLKTAYGHADCESAFCPNCGAKMDGGEKRETD